MRLSRRSVGSPMSRPLRPQLRQLLLALTATWLCAWCAPQKNSQPQAQPNSAMTPQAGVLRVEARSVLVDVIVTDKKGHAVTDLTADDFKVYDNNVPQKIVTFVPPLAEGGQAAPQIGRAHV